MDAKIILTPEPGEYQTPVVADIRIHTKKEFPELLILEFLSTRIPGRPSALSIYVPIPKSEAAVLLSNLQEAQKQARVPYIPEPTQAKN